MRNKRDVPRLYNPWKLSPMECEVMRLVGEGFTQTQIATELCLTAKTIHTYTRRGRNKMKAKTLEHAAVMYDRFLREHHS